MKVVYKRQTANAAGRGRFRCVLAPAEECERGWTTGHGRSVVEAAGHLALKLGLIELDAEGARAVRDYLRTRKFLSEHLDLKEDFSEG